MSWFWEVFVLVLFVVPLITLFAYAAWDDIRRPDIGILPKALWLVVFWIVPIIGPLVYLVIRPPGTTAGDKALAAGGEARTTELMHLAGLHDRGKLSDSEFEYAKSNSLYGTTSGNVYGEQYRRI